MDYNKNLFEIIYIDDASNDLSKQIYTSFELSVHKQFFQFSKNKGRVFATQKGIQLARGDWILLLQSNVVVFPNIINKYIDIINNYDSVAFAGKINYETDDMRFENYLNHPKRGLNSTNNSMLINYENLLFGNCIIKKSIFQKIPLNLNLKYYGGEELDFSYRLNQKYPKMIRYSQKSIVIRKSHPSFQTHLLRLEEFGSKNLLFLNAPLQKKVLKIPFLLNNNFINRKIIKVLSFILLFIYNMKITKLDLMIIKGLLLCHIIKGYYRSK